MLIGFLSPHAPHTRLGTETRTEHETVGGEVRKEQIEVDADDRLYRDRDERRS